MHASFHRAVISFLCLCYAFAFNAHADDAHFSDPSAEVSEVVSLISQRLALMPEVAAWKFANDKPVTDPAREAQVLAATVQQAQSLGIEKSAAHDLFQLQIQLA